MIYKSETGNLELSCFVPDKSGQAVPSRNDAGTWNLEPGTLLLRRSSSQ